MSETATTDRFYVGSQPLYVGTAPYFTVSAQNHPRVFTALETVSHDSGFGCGREAYALPAAWAERISQSEAALAILPDDAARQDFAIGDEADQRALVARHPELGVAHALLNDFFDGPDKTFEPQDADA
jgi:hypothetical protein